MYTQQQATTEAHACVLGGEQAAHLVHVPEGLLLCQRQLCSRGEAPLLQHNHLHTYSLHLRLCLYEKTENVCKPAMLQFSPSHGALAASLTQAFQCLG